MAADYKAASELGEGMCRALGIPMSGVQRIQFELDLSSNHPVHVVVTRMIDWQMVEDAAPAIKTVIERYFRPEKETPSAS